MSPLPYRRSSADFDPQVLARGNAGVLGRPLGEPGGILCIVRSRVKGLDLHFLAFALAKGRTHSSRGLRSG